jgi:hypothetical protein
MNSKSLKKVSETIDNHFEDVLGYYETFFWGFEFVAKKVRYGIFFLSVYALPALLFYCLLENLVLYVK